MRKAVFAAALAVGFGAVAAAGPSPAWSQQASAGEQQQLIDKSKITVEALRGDANLGRTVDSYLNRARAVLIFPNLVKAGFFVGAGGGQGVLVVRRGAGWSDPVFFYAADASFGLQIGVSGGQVLFTVMNDGALQKLLHGNATLGGDLSVAVGPFGGGVQGDTTPNAGADLIAFSLQQGAFAGVALKGGVVEPRHEWNDAYYGPGVGPSRIIEGAVAAPGGRELKVALSSPPMRRTTER